MFHPDQTAKLSATPAPGADPPPTAEGGRDGEERGVTAPPPRRADSSRTQPLRVVPSSEVLEWAPGDVVAERYVIERHLGGGAMGEVFLARDRLLRKPVALKVLKPTLARNRETVRRFLREVALAHSVTHPHVVRIYDTGEANGLPYLSMEYLQGQTLDELIGREDGPPPMTLRELRDLSLEILDGLTAAHEAGVIHRDLKPANVILTHRGAIVMDFGVAGIDTIPEIKPEPADTVSLIATEAGTIFGSPAYMAPELWEGAPATVQSDLYSFGVMLYQLLTSRLPIEAKSATEFLTKLRNTRPIPVRSRRRDCPRNLAHLVARCMSQDPDDRPASARQAAAMIAPLRGRVRRRWLSVGAAVGLSAVAATVWALREPPPHEMLGLPDAVAVEDLDAAIRAWDVGDHLAARRGLERLGVRAPDSAAVGFWIAAIDREIGDESARLAHCAGRQFQGAQAWVELARAACSDDFDGSGRLQRLLTRPTALPESFMPWAVQFALIPALEGARGVDPEVHALARSVQSRLDSSAGGRGRAAVPVRRALAAAEIAVALGDIADAVARVERLGEAHPEAPAVHSRLSGLYALAGQRERARMLADRVEAADPRPRLRLLLDEGRLGEAWERIDERLLMRGDDPYVEGSISMWCAYAFRFEIEPRPVQCEDLTPGLVHALWAWPAISRLDLAVMNSYERDIIELQQRLNLGDCGTSTTHTGTLIGHTSPPLESYGAQLRISDAATCIGAKGRRDSSAAGALLDRLLAQTPDDAWALLLRAQLDDILGASRSARERRQRVAKQWSLADRDLPLVVRLHESLGDTDWASAGTIEGEGGGASDGLAASDAGARPSGRASSPTTHPQVPPADDSERAPASVSGSDADEDPASVGTSPRADGSGDPAGVDEPTHVHGRDGDAATAAGD